MSSKTIKPAELANLRRELPTLRIVDVRTPAEFREIHVEGAKNIPLDQLTPAALTVFPPDEPIYFICQKGGRSSKACEKMDAAGRGHAISVEGGTEACVAAGLPVVRGKKTISLERQVRIAAGSLVLIGTAIGYFVHPAGLGLSAFVGAGLVFSGATDTCGMGMLLAKMPWNQARQGGESCGVTSAA